MKKLLLLFMSAMFTMILVARPPGEVKQFESFDKVELSEDNQVQKDFFSVHEFKALTGVEVEISPGDMLKADYSKEDSKLSNYPISGIIAFNSKPYQREKEKKLSTSLNHNTKLPFTKNVGVYISDRLLC